MTCLLARNIGRIVVSVAAASIVLAGWSWAAAQSGKSRSDQPRDRNASATGASTRSAPKNAPIRRKSQTKESNAASLQPSEIDSLLESELTRAGRSMSPITSDEDFLRRVYVDLTGKPPSAAELDDFVNNKDASKRSRVIDKLLGTAEYARNWARYWRDVIMFHSLDQRARVGIVPFEDWLAEQIAGNVSWDEITTRLITATGPAGEKGDTFLIFAQFDGTPENTAINVAAEMSRVFMGIQIQCAQCHDHPYDEWKREQFHEMAAFFARTVVLRQVQPELRIEVLSQEDLRSEFARKNGLPPIAARRGGRFPSEHQMPDIEDPEKKRTVHPKFLLGQQPSQGLTDSGRRELFASYVTDPSNPWFARAYVNRIWSELMGEGFYEPVDDLGPGREARFPMIINRLASAWRASGYDVKWLFRLITNTEAYQREIRPRDPSAETTPFASVCPTRLSSDQIFDSLIHALGIDEASVSRGAGALNPQARRLGALGARFFFNSQFGVDPSVSIDDVQGTIPQALFMMNSPLVNGQIRAEADTILGRLLAVYENDEELIGLLYKRVLARTPTSNELQTCKDYIREVNSRSEAFEDLLWSLVNSTEFITKR